MDGTGDRAVARLQPDALVVKVNQGGDMVRAVIGEENRNVPVIPVHTTRGKFLRAEPVAALYEQGGETRGHVSRTGGRDVRFRTRRAVVGRSPDRVDALVWAVTHLGSARGRDHGSGRFEQAEPYPIAARWPPKRRPQA